MNEADQSNAPLCAKVVTMDAVTIEAPAKNGGHLPKARGKIANEGAITAILTRLMTADSESPEVARSVSLDC
jgi:hypothetical protein